jgi:glutamyl-tRNA synthetase
MTENTSMSRPVTVRFAPSPTGHIHVGNARTALFNWLYSRSHDGSFILRFDDTDLERSREEFATSILADLRWLGIEPDRIERQSVRFAAYDSAAGELKAKGLLYPCYETPDELERIRNRRRTRGLPPVYDRRALALGEAERAELEAAGRKPHWRFLLPNFAADPADMQRTECNWNDLYRGDQTIDLASMSDPVLIREDGTYLYTLPSVVDDIEMAVSHVIRGDDHVTNTAAQIALFEALSAQPPVFGHHNLLQSETGEGLSKRTGALSIGALREEGMEAMAVAAFASLIGTSEPVQPLPAMADLQSHFAAARVNKAPARFSPDELRALNTKLVGQLDYGQVAERLADLGVEGGEGFWLAVRENIRIVAEAADWWQVATGDIEPAAHADDADFLAEAADCLPPEPWGGSTWSEWTAIVKERTGRKGRQLFMPLRLALTGRDRGPELAALLPFLGRPNTMARLSAHFARRQS